MMAELVVSCRYTLRIVLPWIGCVSPSLTKYHLSQCKNITVRCINYTQKHKKGAALFKIASVKRVVKSKGTAKKWL